MSRRKNIVVALAVHVLLIAAFFGVAARQGAAHRATYMMWLGLLLVWVVGWGALSCLLRPRCTTWVRNLPLPWQLTFLLFATALALLEEAFATSLTNLAPVFGSTPAEAHITASTNYFDVIFHHSVVVFVPMFIAWAWLLTRYGFSAFEAFLLFGLNGLMARCSTGE